MCCPEGTFTFCTAQSANAGLSCNPRLVDSPWRLVFLNNETRGQASQLNFKLQSVAVLSQMGSPDCSTTDVSVINLFIPTEVSKNLLSVIVADNDAPFTIQGDQVVIQTSLQAGATTTLSLGFASKVRQTLLTGGEQVDGWLAGYEASLSQGKWGRGTVGC